MNAQDGVKLVNPNARITQLYGWTAYAKQGAYGGRIHDGIDATSGNGSFLDWPTGAVSSSSTGWEPGGYGNYTVGKIGPWEFLFGHQMSTGNTAFAGLEDTTGYSTGSHWHLRVKLNGVTVDPQVFFNSIGGSVNVTETPEYKQLAADFKESTKNQEAGAKILKQHIIANASLRLLGREAKQVELNNWSGNDWTPDRIMETIRAHPDYRKEREDPQGISEAQAKLDQVKEVVCK